MVIKNGIFRWIDQNLDQKLNKSKDIGLRDYSNVVELKLPNFKIESGKFTTIIGRVGSGKSFLITALIDELVVVSGQPKKHGKIALVP